MPKLPISENKTLKLTNALIAEISAEEISGMLFVDKMENYIRSKGFQPVGPLVQYTCLHEGKDGEQNLTIRFFRQASGYIKRTEPPYSMMPILRVPNCLYVRFTGSQDKISLAYQKLSVFAYEEEIELTGSTYTVFVKQMGDEDIVADIFMERAHD